MNWKFKCTIGAWIFIFGLYLFNAYVEVEHQLWLMENPLISGPPDYFPLIPQQYNLLLGSIILIPLGISIIVWGLSKR